MCDRTRTTHWDGSLACRVNNQHLKNPSTMFSSPPKFWSTVISLDSGLDLISVDSIGVFIGELFAHVVKVRPNL